MRRIAAVVLPHVVCDLARETLPSARGSPLAVLVHDHDHDIDRRSADAPRDTANRVGSATSSEAPASGSDVIAAVDDAAFRAGVRPGHRVSEAMAYTAHLTIAHLSRSRISAALATVAEVGLAFGAVAHIVPFMGADGSIHVDAPLGREAARSSARSEKSGPGKKGGVVRSLPGVWLDVTGAAHLFGGEEALLDDLEERLRVLGFGAQAAIADGPRIAEALARHKGRPGAVRVALPGKGGEALAPLSIDSLPLGEEARSLFVRLGVFTVADFVKLPRAQVTARLGDRAAEVMAIAMGHDLMPLTPYQAPEVLVEETLFDDGVETASRLVFVLKAMVSRLSARLMGRAQAVHRIEMAITYDRSIYRLRTGEAASQRAPSTVPSMKTEVPSMKTEVPSMKTEVPSMKTVVDLPAPLSHEGDLLRAVKAKLEQIELVAPAVALTLTLTRVTPAPRVQLDLSRDVAVSPQALPALLAELAAEIGPTRLGVLSVVDAFLPEKRSRLVPVSRALDRSVRVSSGGGASEERGARLESEACSIERGSPTRLLSVPISLGRVGAEGSLVRLGAALTADLAAGRSESIRERAPLFVKHEAYEVERVTFERRLDQVEWWTKKPASRDYLRVLLSRGDGVSGQTHACEAFVFVERGSSEVYLQGWWE